MLKPFQRFRRLLQVDRKEITQVYVYALFNGLVNLSLPLGIQAIINLIQGGEISSTWVILVVFVMLGIAISGLMQLMQLRIVENISQSIFSRASFEFAYRIPKIQYKALYNYYAPELANRFFDTLTIQKGLPKILIDFSIAIFQIIVGLIVLSLYHPFFILFGLFLVALIYIIIVVSGPRGINTSLKESKYKYDVAHWLEEIARTKLSFKLLGHSDAALDNVDKKVTNYLNARESHFRVLVNQFLSLIGFKVIIAAGLLVIGSLLVFRQEMNIGQFVAAEIIIILIINSVEKLISTLDSIYDLLTALEKIGYVTDMPLDQDNGTDFVGSFDHISTSLQDVSFSFPENEKRILKSISLEIPYNESACIMGPSGSGKSTLMQLWSGILEPTQGILKFNDLSMKTLKFDLIRKHIGFALSNNQIFMGTLLENITVGRKHISHKDVSDAIRLVNLDQFISRLPEGLNTFLDPEGRRVPRSIVNKIILARAIACKPKLLMLEDPLDHVIAEEKEEIIKNITAKGHPWNIIVSTVDKVWLKYIPHLIILENGRVISNSLNPKS